MMGMFWVQCRACGKAYAWFSFNAQTVAQGNYCDHCGADQRLEKQPILQTQKKPPESD